MNRRDYIRLLDTYFNTRTKLENTSESPSLLAKLQAAEEACLDCMLKNESPLTARILALAAEAEKAEIAILALCNALSLFNQDRKVEMAQLRTHLEKYGQHTGDCAKNKSMIQDFLQKQYGGANYSAGPELDCTCGLTAALKGE